MDRMAQHPAQFPGEIVIPSDTDEAHRLQQQIADELKACRFSEREIFGIKLALEEALVNAIKHGNRLDRNKMVRVTYYVRADEFHIRISDEGKGFDPEDVPDPTDIENLERPCGRGLLLMRHYMNEVQFPAPGNTCIMWKRRNGNS